jgi:hypothetical protein
MTKGRLALPLKVDAEGTAGLSTTLRSGRDDSYVERARRVALPIAVIAGSEKLITDGFFGRAKLNKPGIYPR